MNRLYCLPWSQVGARSGDLNVPQNLAMVNGDSKLFRTKNYVVVTVS